jgi:hypothetical protein
MMNKGHSPVMSNSKTAADQPAGGPCRCGCAPCDDHVCELDCLVRPRFFCGQLLTDADLTALVTWTQEKFRLRRYVAGWGVLCGLQVSCDSKNPAGVVVSPGYALDCCGNDVIICDDARLDLGPACPRPECLDPWEEQPASGEQPEGGGTYGTGLLSDLLGGARALDVVLHYAEVGSQPQAAVARSACGEKAACEYSRTREGYRLTYVPAGDDPQKAAADRWYSAYQRAMRQAVDFADSLPGVPADGELQQRLLDWLARYPPHGLCGLEGFIRRMTTAANSPRLEELLFWIVLDYRYGWLACGCVACDAEAGIPLARVWLTSAGECRVLAIHDQAPYRRPLRPAVCLPAPRDRFNLAQVLGQEMSEATRTLAEAGMVITGEAAVTAADWTLLRDRLVREMDANDPAMLFAERGRRLQAYYVETLDYGGRRLVWLE